MAVGVVDKAAALVAKLSERPMATLGVALACVTEKAKSRAIEADIVGVFEASGNDAENRNLTPRIALGVSTSSRAVTVFDCLLVRLIVAGETVASNASTKEDRMLLRTTVGDVVASIALTVGLRATAKMPDGVAVAIAGEAVSARGMPAGGAYPINQGLMTGSYSSHRVWGA